VDLKVFNRHKKSTRKYQGLESDLRPVPHCKKVGLFVPEFIIWPDNLTYPWNMVIFIKQKALQVTTLKVWLKVVQQFQTHSSSWSWVILSGISTYLKKQQKFWHLDWKTKTALEPEIQ